ncbi:SDR family oxidoreductase [Flavobacterium sp. ANB]|uniref:oxidoreductase n=1 Tax=unclassified Flavobacterium TaxID=196869 RepID=UPI0012BA17F2|nr:MULTISPECIES: oxidoreductase [unclassified Flavobacterium]MBF4517625.1 SDR family oxidoreductase [Flavobacterium sp. ANB]MTD70352.1 SDR family oxidoreductase [Flavobacterium sp. LC2016-13]
MNRLKNKIIIVTGGSGLLGSNIIDKIKSEGAFCINVDINHETTENLSLIKCDITDTKSIDKCVKSIIDKYKKIDGLVNNAYPRTSDWGNKFEDIDYQSWQKNVDSQLNSYFYFTQQVSNFMVKEKFGSIINMASVYGIVGPDFTVYDGTSMTMPAAYSAIKGGLINLSRYLASYLGQYNIRVNTISPGGIFDNQNPIFVDNYNRKVPMKRMGQPDDISPSVVFLLSDEASYITGQNLAVDGGWTAI